MGFHLFFMYFLLTSSILGLDKFGIGNWRCSRFVVVGMLGEGDGDGLSWQQSWHAIVVVVVAVSLCSHFLFVVVFVFVVVVAG